MKQKSPCIYGLEIKSILRSIKNSYKNPHDFNLRKSEKVLFKKIEELENLYKQTGQKTYKEISNKALRKYDRIIKKGVLSHSNFISLNKFPEEKILHLNSKEAKRRRTASLEIALMKYEDSGRNVAMFS